MTKQTQLQNLSQYESLYPRALTTDRNSDHFTADKGSMTTISHFSLVFRFSLFYTHFQNKVEVSGPK